MPAQPASDTRLHPLQAIRAVRQLFANPGDTRQIFIIFRALRGHSGLKAFQRFAASPAGAAVLRERRVLLDRLSDRGALCRLTPGSLGRAYADFMQSENLSADGLVQASQDWENDPVPADVKLFRERIRDAHDLTHVLTGYGRDPLGELCLLTFMYRQTRNLGQALIVAMSWPRLPKRARRAVRQAWRNGNKARAFQCLDFEALLERPLADIRGELGIADPTEYRALS
jgi:ubiquinone biosynthesis protein COQ4